MDRRNFLKKSTLAGAAGIASLSGLNSINASGFVPDRAAEQEYGERLYNGIQLPEIWPPRNYEPDSYNPMPVPYLNSPPKVIPIDVGRQLFVDDFLIEYTDLNRKFHQPVKHENNPLLKPETEVEMNQGICPNAAPFSDGCFYDPQDNLYKLWYQAGWFDGTALAISKDGIHWGRPDLNVIPGTNLVLDHKKELGRDKRRNGVSVWLDHEAKNSDERFKMYWYAQEGKIGGRLRGGTGFLLTSPDGIHWKWHGEIGRTDDNSTFYYNPYRKKWCFTVRRFGRAIPPWAYETWSGSDRGQRGRARSYWENCDFFEALDDWSGFQPVFWFGADRYDRRRKNYQIGGAPQIYKVDAAGYESLMIGFIQTHYGPENSVCAKGGFPKLTELQLAFSRDGFHWDRTNRETFIDATLEKDSWERAYIHSIGGVCNVVGDKLYFYYTAFQGDKKNLNPHGAWNGMYANASTGLAILRRDGFASMEAGSEERKLCTRPIMFSGKHLFVNVDGGHGNLVIEICQEDGTPIPGFTRNDCKPVSIDSTKHIVAWNNGDSVESLVDKPIRLKFYLSDSKLYSFWVSRNREGRSGGATAAGGPGLNGTWDI